MLQFIASFLLLCFFSSGLLLRAYADTGCYNGGTFQARLNFWKMLESSKTAPNDRSTPPQKKITTCAHQNGSAGAVFTSMALTNAPVLLALAQNKAHANPAETKERVLFLQVYKEIQETETKYYNQLLEFQQFLKTLLDYPQKQSPLKLSANEKITLAMLNSSLTQVIEVTALTKEVFASIAPDRISSSKESEREAKINNFINDTRIYFTKAYPNYVSSIERYHQFLRDNKRFQKMVTKHLTLQHKQSGFFQDALIAPIQRVPRYELLFRDLLKRIPKGPESNHCEYQQLGLFFAEVGNSIKR
ncbi:MAG: hypothetical protein HQK50_04700 [Oligoflexia bacterium]|nr:hypothetical protein [Oligoflexia bacterium]MBF0364845.1 hypothetical protein [Oligoflexia bacterium]